MSRIDAIFNELRARGRTALMPFITAGYPSLEDTRRLIPALEDAGASIVELGVPFSDPIADGPVIAESMHETLLAGVTPADVLDVVRTIRSATQLGLVLMVSQSIVERLGAADFIARAAHAGCDGLIVPDLDVDSAPPLLEAADRHDMSFSLLVAPTTSAQRLERIADLCRGFVYLLARAGLTGERGDLPPIAERVAAVRAVTDLPVAVGFGISRPEQVHAVTTYADAAIVGSALVRRLGEVQDPVDAGAALVRELVSGLAASPVRPASRSI
ncbi:MAG: tryptophan synthase subunit alpha [Planctomycetota bacterium]|jgi:tryptophan synthase alpha chain